MKKHLLSYDNGNKEDFLSKLPYENLDIYPITNFTDRNCALKYTGIEDVEKFVIDITTIVASAKFRIDLRIIYESWFNSINNDNDDNVFYCVDKDYLADSISIFPYYFDTDELVTTTDSSNDESNNSIIEEIKSPNNKSSSIVDYNSEQFESLYKELAHRLYGHNAFKLDLLNNLEAFCLLHKMDRQKIFSVFICGKSGIGKTEVGRILHKIINPTDSPIKINFGNYSGKGSLWSLIGSPKGYLGSDQGGELTNKIIKSHSKIILIDELDKADDAIYTFFYEMLEDGQYTDLDGNLINLDGYIVIFTANLSNDNFKKKIPEPLFSRFDMTYEFEPLSKEEINKYISDYINELLTDYKKIDESIKIETIKKRLSENKYYQYNNIRIIKRKILYDFSRIILYDETFEKEESKKNGDY